MSRANIVHKEEKRFLYKDPTDGQIVFGVIEMKLEEPHPINGPCMFQIAMNSQIVTRKQLEGMRDCINDALEGVLEGRIVGVPAGARLPMIPTA